MKYIASVRNKTTRKLEIIERDYPNKKEFELDLRGNGYSIRFITTEDKFDEDCEKWHRRSEECSARHKAVHAAHKEAAARMNMTVKQYEEFIKFGF